MPGLEGQKPLNCMVERLFLCVGAFQASQILPVPQTVRVRGIDCCAVDLYALTGKRAAARQASGIAPGAGHRPGR